MPQLVALQVVAIEGLGVLWDLHLLRQPQSEAPCQEVVCRIAQEADQVLDVEDSEILRGRSQLGIEEGRDPVAGLGPGRVRPSASIAEEPSVSAVEVGAAEGLERMVHDQVLGQVGAARESIALTQRIEQLLDHDRGHLEAVVARVPAHPAQV